MQNFWMDTDPSILLPHVAEACARSKYTARELEAIYWNEVRPAVAFNMNPFITGPIPEWAGFEIGWLTNRILETHQFGKRVPVKLLYPYSYFWWRRLRRAIQDSSGARGSDET